MRWWIAAFLVACSSPFDPGSRITRTRLLAVSADRPFARAGETVHLDALAIDPSGGAVRFQWSVCRDVAGPSVADCLASAEAPTDGTASGDLVVDAKSYLGVVVRACGADGCDVGMKRILVRDDRNQNPAIGRVLLDGVEWTDPRSVVEGEHEIVVEAATEAGEQTLVQFYSTSGTFSSEVRTIASPVTKWTGGGDVTFVIVVRDDRGGASWVLRTLRR